MDGQRRGGGGGGQLKEMGWFGDPSDVLARTVGELKG